MGSPRVQGKPSPQNVLQFRAGEGSGKAEEVSSGGQGSERGREDVLVRAGTGQG